MARVKSPTSVKHRKVRQETKGFRQARRTRIKAGREASLHAGQYAYIGRKLRKRDLRALWITRLNIASREHGLTYGKLISGLKAKNIIIDRKILAEIAVNDPDTFKTIVASVK